MSLNHTLANNAGESDVNYNDFSIPCYTGTGGNTIATAFTCTFTLGEGETLEPWVLT